MDELLANIYHKHMHLSVSHSGEKVTARTRNVNKCTIIPNLLQYNTKSVTYSHEIFYRVLNLNLLFLSFLRVATLNSVAGYKKTTYVRIQKVPHKIDMLLIV